MAQNNDEVLKQRILSVVDDISVDWIKEKFNEFVRLMTYYRCAMMEIETKFNVLNEEYSLAYDRNPISSIKTRLKSFPSISEKLSRKGISNDIDSIEKILTMLRV